MKKKASKKIIPRSSTLDRYMQQVAKLRAKHPNNMLPDVTWLKDNGYVNLYQYMRAHPREFAVIPQDKRPKRQHNEQARQKHIKTAVRLAKKNGGSLPSIKWLMKNNYSSLLSYMNKHPDFFKGIKRDKESKSAEEHVRDAEKLAKKYGGILPGGWTIIQETGGWGLYAFIRRHKKLFAHIPRSSKDVHRMTSSKKRTTKVKAG